MPSSSRGDRRTDLRIVLHSPAPTSSTGTLSRSLRIRSSLPAAAWFLIIMVLLSLPGQSFPVVEIWKPDKIAHILLFGTQAVLLWAALEIPQRVRVLRLPPVLFAGLATAVFGALSEGYQAVFTTRMADPYDVIANVIGVALALTIVFALRPARVLHALRFLLRIPD